jgi:hypothetical protein
MLRLSRLFKRLADGREYATIRYSIDFRILIYLSLLPTYLGLRLKLPLPILYFRHAYFTITADDISLF